MTVVWLSTGKNHRYKVVASSGVHRLKRDKNKLRQQMVIRRKRKTKVLEKKLTISKGIRREKLD